MSIMGSPTSLDVVNAYRLVLGRHPESEAVVEETIRHAGDDWLQRFFLSGEFSSNVIDRLRERKAFTGQHHSTAPSPDLINWVAASDAVSGAGKAGVRKSTDWLGLYRSLFEDIQFYGLMARDNEEFAEDLLGLLQEHKPKKEDTLVGKIERVEEDEIAGWAIYQGDVDAQLGVQLFVDGVFCGAGRTSEYRPDIQKRYGGQGLAGFAIRFSSQVKSDRLGELRDARSGRLIDKVRIPQHRHRDIDAVTSIRRQLTELRNSLARIEAHLPSFHDSLGYSLNSYNEYYEAFYAPVERSSNAQADDRECLLDLLLILDCRGQVNWQVHRAVDGILAQTRLPGYIHVLYEEDRSSVELRNELRRLDQLGGRVTITITDACGNWSGVIREALRTSTMKSVLFVRGDGVLAPDGARLLCAALEDGADLVFCDEDSADFLNSSSEFHREPVLRSAFDEDALLQTNTVGDLVGIQRDFALLADLNATRERIDFYDFLLQCSRARTVEEFTHVPRVLFHRCGKFDSGPLAARMEALEAHLAACSPGAWVEQHADVFGAQVAGATRVCYPVASTTKVAIIIPTQDRLDLLGPCIASISRTSSEANVVLQTIVVDHESREQTTRAFLAAIERPEDVRVLPYEGNFNWSLMNNMAAERVDADVFIFLNNDTVALSGASWDILAANALRPQVGAVGARLLYEDGTIQHAGVVLGGWETFARHEGVGLPASDIGYLGRHALQREVSAVTGACLATSSTVFRASGGFDPLLPVEGNDTDYCLRLRSLGLRIIYAPGATFHHFESRTRGFNTNTDKQERGRQATALLRKRWPTAANQDPFYNMHFDRSGEPFTKLQPPRMPPRRSGRE